MPTTMPADVRESSMSSRVSGGAEVGQPGDAVAIQQDVGGLDGAAVDRAVGMHCRQPLEDLHGECDDAF